MACLSEEARQRKNEYNRQYSKEHRAEETQRVTEYQKENTTRFNLTFTNKTDGDLIEYLSQCPNKTAFIKSALRAYIAAGGTEQEPD